MSAMATILDFQLWMILAIFDLQVTLMLPTKILVDRPYGSWEEAKNRASGFLIYKSPWCFLPSSQSVGHLVQEKKRKIDFQDSRHGGYLGIPIIMILAIFLSTSRPDDS